MPRITILPELMKLTKPSAASTSPLIARRNESLQGNNNINLLFCVILVFVMQKTTFRNMLWYSKTDWSATDWRIDLFCCLRLYKHVLCVQIDENMRSNYECASTFQSSQRPWFLRFRFMPGPGTSNVSEGRTFFFSPQHISMCVFQFQCLKIMEKKRV